MRYVLLGDVLDPGPYLRVLPSLKDDLPPGSFRFASDGDHYDFRCERCVHDLEFGRLTFSDEDSGVVELELIGNVTSQPVFARSARLVHHCPRAVG